MSVTVISRCCTAVNYSNYHHRPVTNGEQIVWQGKVGDDDEIFTLVTSKENR